MIHDQHLHIDAAALDREVDHEIRWLRRLGFSTPAICEDSHEIEERCRQRLIAGKSRADFEFDAFLAEAKRAISAAQTREETHNITRALLDRVPDEEWYDVVGALIHEGLLPEEPTDADRKWLTDSIEREMALAAARTRKLGLLRRVFVSFLRRYV